MACCCSWRWVLFLNAYLGSIGTLVFLSWENSPSRTIYICFNSKTKGVERSNAGGDLNNSKNKTWDVVKPRKDIKPIGVK